jgi:hypothetical protein
MAGQPMGPYAHVEVGVADPVVGDPDVHLQSSQGAHLVPAAAVPAKCCCQTDAVMGISLQTGA